MPFNQTRDGGGLLLTDDYGRKQTAQQVVESKIGDSEVVDKVLQLNDFGRREYYTAFKRHDICHKFRNDEQWNTTELKEFTDAKRIPLKFNILRGYGWHLQGLQRMTRADIKIEGVDQGIDQYLAEMTYKILRHISYVNVQEELDSLIFSDGLDQKGDWHIYWDAFKGMMGRVMIERVEPGSVIYDPNCMDVGLTDCAWQARTVYMTPKTIKRRYILELEFSKIEYDNWWEKLTESYKSLINSYYNSLVDNQNNLYAVIELYEREQKRYFKIVDANGQYQGDFQFPIQFSRVWMQMNPGMYVIPGEKSIIRKSCIMPYMQTMLGVEEQELEYYPYVPFISGYSGYRLQENSSYIYALLDPQRALNIWRSNQTEYIQRDLRGGGWVHDDPELTKMLNKDGAHVTRWYDIKGQAPEKNVATFPAAGLQYLEESAGRYVEQVSGQTLAQVTGGNDQPNESGIHRVQRREESQTTVFPILEMFNKQRALVAKVALEQFVKNVKPGTVIKVVGDSDADQQSFTLAENVISQLKSIAEWDIRMSDGPYQTEMQRDEFDRKMEIFQIIHQIAPGVINPGDLIRGSGLPKAEEMAKAISDRYLQILSQPPETGGGGKIQKQGQK